MRPAAVARRRTSRVAAAPTSMASAVAKEGEVPPRSPLDVVEPQSSGRTGGEGHSRHGVHSLGKEGSGHTGHSSAGRPPEEEELNIPETMVVREVLFPDITVSLPEPTVLVRLGDAALSPSPVVVEPPLRLEAK
jgi:hypothetical protein